MEKVFSTQMIAGMPTYRRDPSIAASNFMACLHNAAATCATADKRPSGRAGPPTG